MSAKPWDAYLTRRRPGGACSRPFRAAHGHWASGQRSSRSTVSDTWSASADVAGRALSLVLRAESGGPRSTASRPCWQTARKVGAPVFLTRFALDPSGADIGVYARKRDFLQRPDWCIEGTEGAELLPEVGPTPGDIVFVKKKPSAFHGTPLTVLPDRRGVDTLVVLGGATSNCVRATVFDSVVLQLSHDCSSDAVFDRLPISHAISLFDMDRQFADVMTSQESSIEELRRIGATRR